ncbi:hypothetical protein MMC31_006439 [Peltigera leucophlebia]|nr:hypothetical protein [Peltigera leucophlebia]
MTNNERRSREMYRKRSRSFLRKADQLARYTHAEVYVVICRNGRFSVYNSTRNSEWPLHQQDLINASTSEHLGPEDFDGKSEKKEKAKPETESKKRGKGAPNSKVVAGRVKAQKVFLIPHPVRPM